MAVTVARTSSSSSTTRIVSLPVGAGFLLELTEEDGIVEDMYTHVAYHHIQRFAALCKREGWKMADAEEGERHREEDDGEQCRV